MLKPCGLSTRLLRLGALLVAASRVDGCGRPVDGTLGRMVVVGVVKDGKVELPASVHLPEGAAVRVIVESDGSETAKPFETEPVGDDSVLADIEWATGRRFGS